MYVLTLELPHAGFYTGFRSWGGNLKCGGGRPKAAKKFFEPPAGGVKYLPIAPTGGGKTAKTSTTWISL